MKKPLTHSRFVLFALRLCILLIPSFFLLDWVVYPERKFQGILPICANCKKIRDDEGYWHKVESYIRTNADVSFTHGICPECAKNLYPEYTDNKGEMLQR